jgi:hypothetical protein
VTTPAPYTVMTCSRLRDLVRAIEEHFPRAHDYAEDVRSALREIDRLEIEIAKVKEAAVQSGRS